VALTLLINLFFYTDHKNSQVKVMTSQLHKMTLFFVFLANFCRGGLDII